MDPKEKEAKEAKEKADKEAKEKEAKEAADKADKEKAEKEAKEAGAQGTDPAGNHADAPQDEQLIKKMIDEYIGKSDEMDEQERKGLIEMAREAHCSYKEMGASEAEAYERAGHALKLARHMSEKDAKKEAAAKEANAAKEKEAKEAAAKADADKAKDADKEKADKDAKSKEGKESAAKESDTDKKVKELEAKLLETSGELARLKGETAKSEVEKYIDKKLQESKKPKSFTNAFREAAGEIKSAKEFDDKWAMFTKGASSEGGRPEIDWTPFMEKAADVEPKGGTKNDSKLDFSNCAED